MAFEKLLSETTPDGVLILTMNDPPTLNSLGEPLMPELLSEVDRFAEDGDLRALVITGAGRAFSSGANVRGFARSIEEREQAQAEAGEDSGDLGDGYRWRTVIRAHGEDVSPTAAPLLRAFEVVVRIEWGGGARGQAVELRTLRLAPGLEP